MLAAVILSGGQSSRMGAPKALLAYRGRTFLEHLLDVVRHPKIGAIRVVLGADAERIQSRLTLDPAAVVVNPEWKKGQLSSIQAAIRSLAGNTAQQNAADGMLLCPIDHPLISATLVGTLVERFYASQKRIVLPTFKGQRGHPMIFASSLYAEILDAPLDIGARAVVWNHSGEVLEVPTEEEGVRLNLNDPEALRKALDAGLE